MNSFFVFQREFFLKSIRAFNTKKFLLKRAFTTQNDFQNEVDLLFLKISSLYKSSLQSLNINVFCTIRIETKRKRKTKKTNAVKRDRKFKLSIDSQLLNSFERSSKTSFEKSIKERKTTKQMLNMKNTQQNEIQREKKTLIQWKKKETSMNAWSKDSKKSNIIKLIFFNIFRSQNSNVNLLFSFFSLSLFVFFSCCFVFIESIIFDDISSKLKTYWTVLLLFEKFNSKDMRRL
jgi:hypothetical protein